MIPYDHKKLVELISENKPHIVNETCQAIYFPEDFYIKKEIENNQKKDITKNGYKPFQIEIMNNREMEKNTPSLKWKELSKLHKSLPGTKFGPFFNVLLEELANKGYMSKTYP